MPEENDDATTLAFEVLKMLRLHDAFAHNLGEKELREYHQQRELVHAMATRLSLPLIRDDVTGGES